MKKNYPNRLLSCALFLVFMICSKTVAQNFAQSELNFDGLGDVSNGITSLMYGPDGRLYVAEYPGLIKILTIQRNGPTDYVVTNYEELDGIQTMADHNDDGTFFSSIERETTGMTVVGTLTNPVVYVASSDFRIGAGTGGGNGDVNLDTNSGVITRFTWNGSSWDVVDIVRGLPRSEENHATNGLEFTTIGGDDYLIVAQGGHTNAGSPSTNFVFTCEYALSSAVLAINLSEIEALPIQNDNGRNYIYDLPTLDDPTRPNVNGITDSDSPGYNGVDVNDPWGGNDGLNQAIVDPNGPVQILSPGYRNAYDLVLTESGALYVTDNGANGGWGGFPENEGSGSATNNYLPSEPGSQSPSNGEQIDNKDHLQLITTDIQNYTFNSYYGGHPNPTRANPTGAGLYTDNGTSQVFRTLIYDPDGSIPGSTMDPAIGLPANWPPVQMANPVEGDWRGPTVANPDGPDDDPIAIWGTNTNGIDEYTASNFGGAMQGDLLAGHNGGNIRRVQLENDGTLQSLDQTFLSGISGDALGITCNGDDEVFAGTIWIGTLGGTSSQNPGGGTILVYEPQDFLECLEPGDVGYDSSADGDSDGYLNQDEEDNDTGVCNGGSQPSDFDKAAGGIPLISDLNDDDDDNDNIPDANDPFQLGNPTNGGSDAFTLPIFNDLFNNQQGLGGIFGLGMTGLMNNGDTGRNWMDWLDVPNVGPYPNDVLGGAPGIMTSYMTEGTALGTANSQEKGYQYGVQVDNTTGKFTVIAGMNGFTGPLRLYENTDGVTNGELGIFIGDGTQSNYIKFVVTTDGFTALQEINDVPGIPVQANIPVANRPTATIRFYFIIDPITGVVELEYQLDANSRVPMGSMNATGTVLQAIQTSSLDLAVGFIGTSNTPGKELEGSWDFLNVLGEVPIVAQEIPDLARIVSTQNEDIDLNNYFNDDNGVENLTYTVESNTNTAIGANIASNLLTLTYPSTVESTMITIRATDGDGLFVEDTFSVDVTDGFLVLYRVNSGGGEVVAIDGDIPWEEDSTGNNSQYLTSPGNNLSFSGDISSTDSSVDTSTTPFLIFESERFDNEPGDPNISYSFPVPQPGNYEIRLYMGNGFSGTANAGDRIFDVNIEGLTLPLLSNIDLSGTYGNNVGTVISHILNVTDGALDIQFLHGIIENPLVNGIEILDAPDTETPLYVYPLANQINNAGEQLDGSLGVQVVGGDGNLQFSAVGLPLGLFIEPTNGQIGGTIDESAFTDSPYTVSITVDDSDGLTSDQVTTTFIWNVVEPFAYRINAGGSVILTSDAGPNWEDNALEGAESGNNYSVNTGLIEDFGGIIFENKHISVPAYIDAATFDTIFAEERYDEATDPKMEYVVPLENGDYMVHLYVGNSFDGADEIGNRVFDILLEGAIVENDLDIIERFGHEIGGMLSYPVSVADGELNISFAHEIENPLVNAIEIFVDDPSNPLVLDNIEDQTNEVNNVLDFTVSAIGGNATEEITYYMTGQPDGISIDAVTGQISGTIDITAATGGSNNDGVHSVVVTAFKPMSAPSTKSFTWTITSEFLWTNKDENEDYTARHENSFVQAGDKFYLMGGRENAQTIDVYDYTSDSWTSLVDSAPFEFNHFQATEYQGLIWVIGALKTNNFPSETPAEFIWMFDPANQEWIQGPAIPVSRQRGSAGLVVYNDKFYIVAGSTNGHDGGFVNWFDEYDPATGIWTPLADAPNARDHFAAVLIGDKLYAAGGRLSGGTGGVWKPTIAEVDVYDFGTESWTTLPIDQNIPTPRGGAAAVNFDDKLVVIGGEVQNELVYGVNTDDALKITEQYNPTTQSWERLPDMNFERHGTQAIVSGPGIHILAGADNRGGGNQKNMEFLGDDNPFGTPSVASILAVPNTVVIDNNTAVDVDINVTDGNTGIFIRSMELTGADADDFSIESGELTNSLLNAGSTHTLNVSLTGNEADKTAILTINFNNSSSVSIALTNNPNVTFGVSNPGDQYSYEGDSVSLQIEATSANVTSYSASGLPPDLSIDPNTGIISGVIDDGIIEGGMDEPFQEENGLVIIEAESTDTTGWNITNLNGETGIIANTNSLGSQNGTTLSYDITISTPGVYRVNWRSFYSGTNSTDENDNWLKFPNNDDVWFFGIDESLGNPGNELDIINLLQSNNTKDLVFPGDSGRETIGLETAELNQSNTPINQDLGTEPIGSSSNGFFKIYRSGGNSQVYDWQARTSDFDPHSIYVWFVNPGTYTMEISERSSGHAIDRLALYKVDTYGFNYNTDNLTNAAESQRNGDANGPGAAENSPYNVSITVSDDGDPPNDETIDFVWYVGEPGDLIAVPEANVINGVVPLTVDFTGSNSLDDVGVTSYLWNFKDGTTSTNADPSHTFNTIGTFNVDLTVGDIDGNSDTKSIAITVEGTGIPPTAVASANIIEGTAPLEVVFDGNASTDDIMIMGYTWDFIDGGTSTEVSPTYIFSEPGIYDVVLSVTDIEGLVNTDVVTITVNSSNLPPVAVAEATPISGDAPLEVSFTGSNSTDDVGFLEYMWNFGDGGTSTEADLTYTYMVPGTYIATLTVTDEEGLIDTDEVTITVNQPNLPPMAIAEATPLNGNSPLEVNFTGSNSTDDVAVASYFWNFADGGTSTEESPIYIFDAPGVYSVQLIVTDGEGLTDMDTVTITVSGTGNQPPTAFATANPTQGEAPLPVIFDATGSTDDSGLVSYFWDFQNGITSEEINPVYTFEIPGVYNVSLTVVDEEGLMGTDIITIIVDEPLPNEAPVAIAEATPLNGNAPLEVSFMGSNSTDDSAVISYAWDFGDGSVSDEADPTYTFDTVGTYNVILTVADNEGLTDMATVIIQVTEPGGNQAPVAMAEATPINGDAPLEVNFTGSNSTDDVGVISYLWDFGDGGTSTEADPTHIFNSPGMYTVELLVTDGEGLVDSDEVTIQVTESSGNQAPVAMVEATPISGNAPLEVTFTGIGSTDDVGIVSYSWDFGDGNLSTEANPTYTFEVSGSYQVTLTVQDGQGLSDSASITIEVMDNTTLGVEMAAIVAPNPASNFANLQVVNLPIENMAIGIKLHDSTGRLLGSFDPLEIFDGEQYTIPISSLRDGLYYITIEMNQGDPIGIELLVKN